MMPTPTRTWLKRADRSLTLVGGHETGRIERKVDDGDDGGVDVDVVRGRRHAALSVLSPTYRRIHRTPVAHLPTNASPASLLLASCIRGGRWGLGFAPFASTSRALATIGPCTRSKSLSSSLDRLDTRAPPEDPRKIHPSAAFRDAGSRGRLRDHLVEGEAVRPYEPAEQRHGLVRDSRGATQPPLGVPGTLAEEVVQHDREQPEDARHLAEMLLHIRVAPA